MKVSVNVPRTDYIDVGFQQGAIAIAQDAKAIAYTARRDGKVQLFVRRLDENAATVVPGSEGAHNPFFSPDGQWIAFFAGEKLKKAFVRGGEPQELLAAAQDRGGAWLQDGSIVVAPSTASPLVRISSSGGAAEALTELDANRKERTHRWPCALPGGEWLLFVIGTIDRPGDYDHAAVSAFSLKTKERRDVCTGASMVKYSPSGHLILALRETLYAAPFDLGSLKVTGTELPVVSGVAGSAASGNVQFDVARDGTLTYLPNVPDFNITELVWMDRSGQAKPIAAPPQPYRVPRLSSDGKQVIVCIGDQLLLGDIWSLDLEHGKLNRLTFDQHSSMPALAPDGTEFAYWCLAGGNRLQVKALDQGATPRDLGTDARVARQPSGFTADGKAVLFDLYGDTKSDIMVIPVDGSAPARAIAEDPFTQWGPVMSPDGRWVAFVSNESGRDEIYVRSWSQPTAKWQVSNAGGLAPVWARDGRELYYLRGSMLVAVPVDIKAANFSIGTARELFTMPTTQGIPKEAANYDVSADGRFLTTHLVHPEQLRRASISSSTGRRSFGRLVPTQVVSSPRSVNGAIS